MPSKKINDNQLYVAEKLGSIEANVEGIKQDIAEIKNFLTPLQKKVYCISGGIAVVGFIISIIATAISRVFLSHTGV